MREHSCVHAASPSPSPSVRIDRFLPFRKGIASPIEPEWSPFWTFPWIRKERPCKDRPRTVHGSSMDRLAKRARRSRHHHDDGGGKAMERTWHRGDGCPCRWNGCIARKVTEAMPCEMSCPAEEDRGVGIRKTCVEPWDGVVTGLHTAMRLGKFENYGTLVAFLAVVHSVRHNPILDWCTWHPKPPPRCTDAKEEMGSTLRIRPSLPLRVAFPRPFLGWKATCDACTHPWLVPSLVASGLIHWRLPREGLSDTPS